MESGLGVPEPEFEDCLQFISVMVEGGSVRPLSSRRAHDRDIGRRTSSVYQEDYFGSRKSQSRRPSDASPKDSRFCPAAELIPSSLTCVRADSRPTFCVGRDSQ
jgi:hypothetical protein